MTYSRLYASPLDGSQSYSIVAAVAANALTITIKDIDGSTSFSNDNPLNMMFEGDSGVQTQRLFTSSPSITVAATTKLGIGATLTSARVHVFLFDNSGTPVVAVFTSCDYVFAAHTTIYPFENSAVASTTQITTGANSNGVFYTPSAALTNKAYRYLGFIDFDPAWGATLGNWDTAPARTRIASVATKKAGDTIQLQRVHNGGSLTGTTTIPYDNTIPQKTEGDEYLTLDFTPKYKTSALRVTGFLPIANNGAPPQALVMALFRDTESNARCTTADYSAAANYNLQLFLRYVSCENSVSTMTWKLRAGGTGAGTTTVGGAAGGQEFGGSMLSWLEVEEVAT